jgi:hypothetical protein
VKNALALAIVGLTAIPGIAAAQAPPPEQPVVVTTGEGVVKRAPDRAWVTVAAESRAKTPQEAQKQNAAAMSSVLAKLKGAGIPAEAIQTSGYVLQPEFDYRDGRQTLRGYLARNTANVRVDELQRLGEIIDIAVSSGATMIAGVRFDVKDRAALERECLTLAVGDARRRAAALAAGADMKVVSIVRIEEHGSSAPPPPRPVRMAQTEALQASEAPPIEPGEIEIRTTVTLTAAIR